MTAAPSLWADTVPDDWRGDRPALPGDMQADVAIVGAGCTGLWTAYYLAAAQPDARIVVLEAEHAGFGASGRNGGWCSAILPVSLDTLAAAHGRDAAIRMQRAMHGTVVEVGRVVDAEGIDCHFRRGGTLGMARTTPQVTTLRAEIARFAAYGFGDADHRWLDATEAAERCRASRLRGAHYTPHCAAVHPARLAHGLARVVAGRGVAIYERTRVVRIEPRRAITDRGVVRADVVVRATEAYTARLPGAHRELLPLYSLMIATEPLDTAVWDEIGLAERPTFNDDRRLVIYGQRTADGRLAFGGRGAPYHFGSTIRTSYDRVERVRRHLAATLHDLFPQLPPSARITHHWGGPLGVPRDFHPSVRLDRATGLATAGGYVGDGVAATNLAGRTLADLIRGEVSELTELPWVDHRSRRWEPEPVRWIGANVVRVAAARADQIEQRTDRPSRLWGPLSHLLSGH
jgi:glycine/D-amino acid oxidase-like deaminating enzyme